MMHRTRAGIVLGLLAFGAAALSASCGGSSDDGGGSGNGGAGLGGKGGASGSGGASGTAGTGGASGSGSGGTGGNGMCGGFAGLTCEGTDWCDYDEAAFAATRTAAVCAGLGRRAVPRTVRGCVLATGNSTAMRASRTERRRCFERHVVHRHGPCQSDDGCPTGPNAATRAECLIVKTNACRLGRRGCPLFP